MPDKTFTNPLTDEHVKEAERLKKAWFEHMFNSLARLGETVDKLNNDLLDLKNLLYKEIFDVKDILRRESMTLKKDVDFDIDKAERRINKLIDDLGKKVDSSSVKDKDYRSDFKKDLERLRNDSSKEFDAIKKESLAPLKEDVIKLRITMAKWGGLGGIIAATLFSIIKWVAPFILKIIQHIGL
jgi:hypothetical protein